MSLRNQATRLMLDQIDTVKCAFEATVNANTKLYTYKCKKGQFTAGDLAVIKDSVGRYKIVQVCSVDNTASIDAKATYDYAWLVDKVDKTQYEKCLAAEQTLMDYLKPKTALKGNHTSPEGQQD